MQNPKKRLCEDDILDFKEELEKLDKVWDYSIDIIGTFIRNMPEVTTAAIEK